MKCDICHKKIYGKEFKLEIKIQKNILTGFGFGETKDYLEIAGHYYCLKKKFKVLQNEIKI